MRSYQVTVLRKNKYTISYVRACVYESMLVLIRIRITTEQKSLLGIVPIEGWVVG